MARLCIVRKRLDERVPNFAVAGDEIGAARLALQNFQRSGELGVRVQPLYDIDRRSAILRCCRVAQAT